MLAAGLSGAGLLLCALIALLVPRPPSTYLSACLGVSGEPRAVSLREHLTGCESWGLSCLCAHLLYSSFVLLTSHFSFSRLYILCIKMLP